MEEMGVNIITSNVEYGPGQFEIVYHHEFGLQAGDNAFTFKTGVKEIAQRHGLIASFMSKPWQDQCGSGCHYNHSLWSLDRKHAVFYDSERKGLSQIGEYWLGGILAHARGLTVLHSPTLNCFRRFTDFSFAPTLATWGEQNRTCAVRVKVNGEGGTYFEDRLGCGAANPYLLMAGIIAAGIDGIQRKIVPPAKTMGVAYKDLDAGNKDRAQLPKSLAEGLEALQEDTVLCEALGRDFVKCFVALKKLEVDKGQKTKDHNLEMERELYFEFL